MGLRGAGLASAALLAMPAAAFASGSRVVLAPAILGFVGHAFGSVFHAIAGVVLGGLNWTVSVAGKFIVNTLGGLIRLLIPSSWAKDGLAVMHWIVAVPDYAGTITTPGGHTVYGFAGINALRDLFMWIGAGLLPLTLVYATSRATFGFGGHVAAPVGRVVALAGVLVSYPWWWSQAAAVVNQLTHFVLALPPVTQGLYRLMQYAVGGVALGGWQLIDLALMGAIGVALLGLIFLKVVVVLLGALLYATGPLMIALVPTQGGLVIARAWASAALALVCLPLVWSSILAVRRAVDQRQLDRWAVDRRVGNDFKPARRAAARARGTGVAMALSARRTGGRRHHPRPIRQRARRRSRTHEFDGIDPTSGGPARERVASQLRRSPRWR